MHLRSLTILLALTSLSACRDGRVSTSVAAPPAEHHRTEASESAAPPLASAFTLANDEVESARILAIGVSPFAYEVRGFALPTYTELPDLTYAQMLDRIASVGATHVSIVTSWDQQTIYHNRLAPNRDTTPSAKQIGAILDHAHSLGLKTLLFPIIHVERRADGEWRGKLAPTDLDRWQRSYRDFIMHHAEIAARHDATILSIGSELSSREAQTEFWTKLIADVRTRYGGKVLYSANWDHFTTPKFWRDLDYVGVSSYFEVARRNDEPIHTVTERWLEHRDELIDFARKVGRPLVLTEVGYPAIDSAAVKPWDYTARTAPNPNAQLAAFQSLATAWNLDDDDAPHFAGLFIWHGWGHGGPADVSYPIWGKSTERLVRRWYAAP